MLKKRRNSDHIFSLTSRAECFWRNVNGGSERGQVWILLQKMNQLAS